MMEQDELLTALKRRAFALGQRPAPPASGDQVAAAETLLGFPLPALLRAAYSRVGNGGFGPGRGLLPIHGPGPEGLGRNAVEEYLNTAQPMPGYPDLVWPAGMLPFCWWGEGVFSYADCSGAEPQVYRFEPPADWAWDVQGYHLHAQGMSLGQWLRSWADGRDVDARRTSRCT